MKNFSSQYQRYKEIVDRQLRSCVRKNEPLSLYQPVRYVLSGGGKRIRPLLVLLSCEAVGGSTQQAQHAAVAVEILHNFTLVHDDIMDNAPSRRGRATVHTKWDTNIAILVGDELVALVYRELLKTRSPYIARVADIFTERVVEVCEGQAYDKEFETRKHVSLDEYLLMIGKKTGKMVSVASEMGAVIGGGSPSEIRALKLYGTFIGRAFQIQDDLRMSSQMKKNSAKRLGAISWKGKKRSFLLKRMPVPGEPTSGCCSASSPAAGPLGRIFHAFAKSMNAAVLLNWRNRRSRKILPEQTSSLRAFRKAGPATCCFGSRTCC